MINIVLLTCMALAFEQPDTTVIKKKFDMLKNKGTAERVIAVNDGTKTTFSNESLSLLVTT